MTMSKNLNKVLISMAVVIAPLSTYADGRGHGRGNNDDGYGNPTVDVSAFAGANFQTIDDGFDSTNPDGYDLGVRGKIFFGHGLFLGGEYTYANADDQFAGDKVKYKLDEFRLGGGLLMPIAPEFKLGGYAHYVNQQVDTTYLGDTTNGKATGYDVGGLIEFNPSRRAQIYGRLGYISLEPENNNNDSARADGVDLLVGLSYKITRETSLFGEYRYTNLQDDFSESDYSSVRGGVRFQF